MILSVYLFYLYFFVMPRKELYVVVPPTPLIVFSGGESGTRSIFENVSHLSVRDAEGKGAKGAARGLVLERCCVVDVEGDRVVGGHGEAGPDPGAR